MRAAIYLIFALLGSQAQAQDSVCRTEDGARALDFWLGDWTVHSNGEQVGTNGIVRALDGCAVFEHWENRFGNQGKSLFYFDAVANLWQQVWVTEDTSQPGGLKLKTMVGAGDGMIRFQGTLEHPARGQYLDRTTLTRQPDGSVRQLIEISFDDGATWQPTFDAFYRKVETP